MAEFTDKRKVGRRLRHARKRLKRISRAATLGGIFLSFLRLGFTGFGGGLAVIAQIRALTVYKRRWLTEHEFSEAFALAQSLPGTNAGNAATYIGYRLRGWRGAAAAMSAFVLPSMLMMILLAILHRHLRALPEIERLFNGLTAAVVALILVTALRVGRQTLTQKWQWMIAVFAFVAVTVFRATIIEVVLVAGLAGIYRDSFAERRWQRWRRIRRLAARRRERIAELADKSFVGGYLTRALAEERVRRMREVELNTNAISDAIDEDVTEADGEKFNRDNSKRKTRKARQTDKVIEATNAAHDVSEAIDADEAKSANEPSAQKPRKGKSANRARLNSVVMFAVAMPITAKLSLLLALASVFLRVGAATFGGGLVMIPLIEAEVVEKHHWLSHQDFADATALGQITPGPVLITATFVGYRVAGTLGALVATITVFLPAFLMTLAAGSSLRRFRANRQVQSFLRGVTPAVVGLLIAAAWSIGRAGIHTWLGAIVAAAATFIYARFRPNPFWIMFGTGVLTFIIGKIGW
jgi:chromate transport protein ChrA